MGKVKLTIGDDGKLEYEWTGKKGTGSLYQLMASGNHKLVNELGVKELWCLLLCVKHAPFPLGGGEKAYRRMLEIWDEGGINTPDIRNEEEKEQEIGTAEDPPPAAVGRLRQYVVQKAGGGCNAPHDSYLRVAHDIATTGKVKPENRY
jgi:hypothetical protein